MPFLKKSTVLFDLVHNEMLNVDEDEFSKFRNLLQGLNVKIKKNEDKDLSDTLLNNVDILLIGNPIDDYFSNIEIKAIVNFVRNGGGLLLISEYGADYLQKTNLNDLSNKHFGIYFDKNIVKEENKKNANCSSVVSLQIFDDHIIANQIREVIVGGACSLLLNKISTPLLQTNDFAWTESYDDATKKWIKEEEPQKHVVAAYAKYGRGKVVAIGDIDLLTNNANFGIEQLDNQKFLLNVLNWLAEPIKDSDVMFWILNQMGSFQSEIKEMNNKINNIIETMTLLENRICTIEPNSTADNKDEVEYKEHLEKKSLQEPKSPII